MSCVVGTGEVKRLVIEKEADEDCIHAHPVEDE